MGKKKDKKKAKKKEKNNNKGKNRKNFVPENKRGKGRTKTSKHWDKYFQEFNDALKPRGLFTRDVEGDGNCLFRAIADQLDGDESVHKKYRDMAVEFVTKNKDIFGAYLEEDQSMDKILKEMDEDGTWGGFFEQLALSAVLDLRFCIHLKDEERPFFVQWFEQTKCKKLCHLAYHIDQHYSSVRNLDDDTKLPAAPINVVIPENDDSSSSSEDDDSDDGDEGDKEVNELAEGVENLKIDKKKSKNSKNEKTEKKMVKEESEDDESSEEEQQKSKWNKKSKKNKNDSDSEEDKKNGKDNRKKNKKKK